MREPLFPPNEIIVRESRRKESVWRCGAESASVQSGTQALCVVGGGLAAINPRNYTIYSTRSRLVNLRFII